MIGFLSGIVKYVSSKRSFFILDVNSVGYRVEMNIIDIKEGEKLDVFIYTYKREQELRLIGFKTALELELFEDLISVSGVGPKAALAMINGLGVDKLTSAIENQSVEELKVKGVGVKTAQKIILDLRGKLVTSYKDSKDIDENKVTKEVFEALESLGYSKKEIESAFSKVKIDIESSSEDILKEILKVIR